MKKILTVCVCLFAIEVFGQDEAEPLTGYGSGAMIYLQPGTGFRMPNNMGFELNTLLRESENYPQNSFMAGIGGMYKFPGKLTLTTSAIALIYPSVDGNSSTVDLTGFGGDLNVGYTVVNGAKWLGFPRLGVGILNYLMTIDNFGALVNQGNLYINPNDREKINGSVVYIDFGLEMFRMFIPQGGGGYSVGISFGFQQSVAGTMWETNEGFNLDNISDPELSNLYLKLNIGGGLFK